MLKVLLLKEGTFPPGGTARISVNKGYSCHLSTSFFCPGNSTQEESPERWDLEYVWHPDDNLSVSLALPSSMVMAIG
jgi:hypothetical protein